MADPNPVVRSPDEIKAALLAAEEWLPRSRNPGFVRGAIAGYRWILGASVPTPVSGEWLQISLETIRREERLADDAIYAHASDIDQDFAVGAQNALLWLRGADRHPPISTDG